MAAALYVVFWGTKPIAEMQKCRVKRLSADS